MSTIEIPEDFLCPITRLIMVDPVILTNGSTYERDAISEWLETNKTDPLTNEELPNTNLVPNRMAKTLISTFLKNNDSLWDTEVYLSKSKAALLVSCICSGDIQGVDRIVSEDRRFLTRKLKEDKTIFQIVLENGNIETVEVVFRKMNNHKLLNLEEKEKISILKKLYTRLQSPGALTWCKLLEWKSENFQNFLELSILEKDIVLLNISILLGADLNSNTKTNPQLLPIELALENFDLDILKIIINSGSNIPEDFLVRSLNTGKLEILQFLFDKQFEEKINVNYMTPSGDTILTISLKNKQNQFIHEIFDKIGNKLHLNTPDKNGVSPFMIAIEKGTKDIVNLFCKYDINLSRVDDVGNTVLHYAAIRGDVEIFLECLHHCSSIKRKNISYIKRKNTVGKTPLDVLEESGNLFLLKKVKDEYQRIKLEPILNQFHEQIDVQTQQISSLQLGIAQLEIDNTLLKQFQEKIDVQTQQISSLELRIAQLEMDNKLLSPFKLVGQMVGKILENIPKSRFKLWELIYNQPYSHPTKDADIEKAKSGCLIAVGASQKGSDVLTLVAVGSVEKALTKTNQNSTTREDNISSLFWYFYQGKTFGFSDTPQVNLGTADTVSSKLRLSWHLEGSGGYRVGTIDSLNSDSTWEKFIYVLL